MNCDNYRIRIYRIRLVLASITAADVRGKRLTYADALCDSCAESAGSAAYATCLERRFSILLDSSLRRGAHWRCASFLRFGGYLGTQSLVYYSLDLVQRERLLERQVEAELPCRKIPDVIKPRHDD